MRAIADSQSADVAGGLGHPQGFECIGGFARLGQRDKECSGWNNYLPVTVLTGDFNLARQFSQGLNPVFAYGSSMIARATGNNLNMINSIKNFISFMAKSCGQ